MSHTPEAHARMPTLAVHVLPGTACPLLTFGWHMPGPERSLHQLPAAHSASVEQRLLQAPVAAMQKRPPWTPGAVQSMSLAHSPHAPLALQYGLVAVGQAFVAPVPSSPSHATQTLAPEQTGAAPLQSANVLQTRQAPAFAPPVTQIGSAPVGHGRVALPPKLPLQAAQTSVAGAVLHVGTVPVQFTSLPRAHAPQACLATSQTIGAAHSLSPSHCTHERVAGSQTGAAIGQSEPTLQPSNAQNAVTSGVGVETAAPLAGHVAPLSVPHATRTRPTPPLPAAPAHWTEPLPPVASSTAVPSVAARAEMTSAPPAPPPPPPSQLSGPLIPALAPRALMTAPVGAFSTAAAM
jgi:hypothetical protein